MCRRGQVVASRIWRTGLGLENFEHLGFGFDLGLASKVLGLDLDNRVLDNNIDVITASDSCLQCPRHSAGCMIT